MMIQLDFFTETKTEVELLKEEIEAIRASSDKVRKGIFVRHAELAKSYMELHNRLEILERNICIGKSWISEK